MAEPEKEARPYSDLGRQIAAARKHARLSQRALADRVHISSGYVPHIEAGRARPDPEVLRRISAVTGADYQQLAVTAGYLRAQDVGGEVEVRGVGPKAALLRRLAAMPEQVLSSALDFIGALGGGVEVREESDPDQHDGHTGDHAGQERDGKSQSDGAHNR